MSEEEILEKIENMLLHAETQLLDYEALAIQGLLDLYNKEKEKNKELENRLNQMYNKQQIYDLDEINHSHISFN